MEENTRNYSVPGRHPAMDLIAKGLDIVLDVQSLAELLHRLCVFISGSEQRDWHGDFLRVGGINHCGVHLGDSGEDSARAGGQRDNL